MTWAMSKVLNGFESLPNEKFHTFAIKFDGKVVGELKWSYRTKNAGGYAWKGTLFNAGVCGMDATFYDKNKENVLDWFKTQKGEQS